MFKIHNLLGLILAALLVIVLPGQSVADEPVADPQDLPPLELSTPAKHSGQVSFGFGTHGAFSQMSGIYSLSPRLYARYGLGVSQGFGRSDLFAEVPPIAIKNVSISVPDDGENSQCVVHSWPLKEEEGETVADQVGGVEAAQYNCLWLAGRQRQWMPETRIPMDPLDPVVFDKSRSRILLVGKSALTIFRLSDGTKSRVQYRSPRPLRNDQVKGTYDDAMDCILVYHNGTGQVSIYSDSSRTWTPIDTTTAQDQHYYAHATFSDPVNGALYAMGGYGWYTAKNTVQMYLFADQRWEPVAIAGSDRFTPRYSTVVARGDSSHLWC